MKKILSFAAVLSMFLLLGCDNDRGMRRPGERAGKPGPMGPGGPAAPGEEGQPEEQGEQQPDQPAEPELAADHPCRTQNGGTIAVNGPLVLGGVDELGLIADADLAAPGQGRSLYIETYFLDFLIEDYVAELGFAEQLGGNTLENQRQAIDFGWTEGFDFGLTGNTSYDSCVFCAYLLIDDVFLMAEQGTWHLDDLFEQAGIMSGFLKDVRFRETRWDAETNSWKKVPNGCSLTVASYAFDASL